MPARQIRDGIVVTEYLNGDDYVESTLREIEVDIRAYVESLPSNGRTRDVMREVMPGIGCESRVVELLCRIPAEHDRQVARIAVEWAMLAVQAHEHVLGKLVEPEVLQAHRVATGRRRGGLKAGRTKRAENAARDKQLTLIARRLMLEEKLEPHRVVTHMIERGLAGSLSDDTLRSILQAAGVIEKRKAART